MAFRAFGPDKKGGPLAWGEEYIVAGMACPGCGSVGVRVVVRGGRVAPQLVLEGLHCGPRSTGRPDDPALLIPMATEARDLKDGIIVIDSQDFNLEHGTWALRRCTET